MVTPPALSEAQLWLVEQWNAGQSATQIGRACGRTRNAVLGQVHRLRGKGVALQGRETAGRPMGRTPAPPRPPKVKPEPRRREIAAPFDEAIAVRVEDAGHSQCRWPFGDPAEDSFRYCGRPKFGGNPYCEAHCADAYQPRHKRHKEEAA